MTTASNSMVTSVKVMIRELARDRYLYFDEVLKVKSSPHTEVKLWGVCLSPATDLKDATIYVMDSDQYWYIVIPYEGNAALVIASLYQRLTQLSKRYNHQPVPQVSAYEVQEGGAIKLNVNNHNLL